MSKNYHYYYYFTRIIKIPEVKNCIHYFQYILGA